MKAPLPLRYQACAAGRTTISFTSTSDGCSIANATARAIASGGIAIRSRAARISARAAGSVTPSAKPVAIIPGLTVVTRSVSPASCRRPSWIARIAVLVAA